MTPLSAQVQKLRRTLLRERAETIALLERLKTERNDAKATAENTAAIDAINAAIRRSNKWDWPGARYGALKTGGQHD